MNNEDELNDPPLLEELDIDIVEIYRHLKAVLLFHRGDNIFANYTDLSGPLLVFILFGFTLLFSGKLCFKILYVVSLLSNIFTYYFLNVLSQGPYINLSKVFTIFGYSLLPLCFSPIIWIFSGFLKSVCIALIYACVLWSTLSASYLVKTELEMQDRQYLVAYPIFVYYTLFANIVIF
ncbi:golgi membrane protein yip1domain containing protein [Theileria equi strain WA]|uniref:Golgi membrane protein yip1domain containing protein n=1 Tax=Theileria equi strain WA TaxID=1537102 RepID=L1LEJ8_THEEQ|nr:golgi membrane protein yip1domain containing protein [Theileria equi strain WA]EKX73852.1 golgi membrane protein yip1domain containing protein [Theileria equi strain WA]|eukprot:XP_004833304.1 golgi membrane protein yip1domain containing protein [Theileria equi strain WA]